MRANRGVALLLVLWALVLLGTLALGFSWSMRTEAMAARNGIDETRAYFQARTGVNRAIVLLAPRPAASRGGRREERAEAGADHAPQREDPGHRGADAREGGDEGVPRGVSFEGVHGAREFRATELPARSGDRPAVAPGGFGRGGEPDRRWAHGGTADLRRGPGSDGGRGAADRAGAGP